MTVRLMPALTGIVVLAVWLGAAALVAGVVAPAAFAVLPTRTLAGALVGRVLPAIFWSGMVLAVAVIVLIRASGAGNLGIVGAIITFAGCAIAQLVISPRIERIRAAIAGPVDALDLNDPRRLEFGRLHGMSVLAMGVAGLGAILAMAMLIRHVAARNAG